jgi:hypothetical protein
LTVVQEAGATVAGGGVPPGVTVDVDPGVAVPWPAVPPGVAEPGLLSEGDALAVPMVLLGVGVFPPPRPPPQLVRTSALARRNRTAHRCAGFMDEA